MAGGRRKREDQKALLLASPKDGTVLRGFPSLPISPIETIEALEQLRVLWHGHRIAVHISSSRPGPGVDTPQDLERVRALIPASVS